MKTVPIIRLDHLSDEQRRGYALAHNKTAELSEWDFDTLDMEIGDISLDMSRFGFDFSEPVERFEEDFGAERDRTDKGYNLHLLGDELLTPDFWQMPVIQNDGVIPDDLIGFNYVKSTSNTNNGVHFYIDDYQFERIWNKPEQYVDLLARHQCIISPDFSLYLDMPMPMKIWNVYRSRMIGAFYQSQGIKVVPAVQWAEPGTYAFCFRGIPVGSIVAVSTVGVMRDESAREIFYDGLNEMIKQIQPSQILLYGKSIDIKCDIPVKYYKNKVTERMNGKQWEVADQSHDTEAAED